VRYTTVNVSIFGLGYVGTVSAACLSKHGHTVIGVDTNPLKVEAIRAGESPVVEPGVTELLKEAIADHRLSATVDALQAILGSELSLVCVGTPSRENGSLNLDFVFAVAREIGEALKGKSGYHGVAIRSTVMPGTIERVKAIIEQASGKKCGRDFGLASNPEFLREGTAVQDFEHPPFTVVGASDVQVEGSLRELYSGVQAPFYALEIQAAEFLKYSCNVFHAVKVAFANEIGAISKQLGIDSRKVMEVFVRDTKLNISPYYLRPGFAFGGSCLPKDVRALAYQARSIDVSVPLLDSLLSSNEHHIQRAIDWVLRAKKKNVGVLGLSFKSDTDDLRESPIVKVVETLLGKGYVIRIYDANVNLSRLIGANKKFIEQEIPHISSLMKGSIREVLENSDVLLVANKAPEFRVALEQVRPEQKVLDLVGLQDIAINIPGNYEGICW
jgi:GDP-mannose 6-dehydrogenase